MTESSNVDAAGRVPHGVAAGRLFFFLLLPLIWGAGALIGFAHPGDEYGLWFVSSLAGTWLTIILHVNDLLPGDIHHPLLLISAVTTGVLVMLGAGYGMDRLRVSKVLWALLYLVLGGALLAWSVGSYPSIREALNKNGSWIAYIAAASNAGITLSVVLSFVVTALARWAGRGRRAAAREGIGERASD